jgi:glycosyltransferase involved in cell wall biosynthesis
MISIVLPSRDRLFGLKRSLDSIYETTKGYEIEIIVVLDISDKASHELVTGMPFVKVVTMSPNYKNGNPQRKLQSGYKASNGEWIVFISDDIVLHKGWLEAMLAWPNGGFIGFLDPNFGDMLCGHFMVSRECVETVMHGRFGLTWYYVWWADNEWKIKMQNAGIWSVCTGASFDHLHADYSNKIDATNEAGRPYRHLDQITFRARLAAGFPEDWPEVGND